MTAPDELERPVPHSVEAERAVLGACMLSVDAYQACAEILGDGADLYRPAHQTIWTHIAACVAANGMADPVLVMESLGPKELARVGGASYLHTLYSSAPISLGVEPHAEVIADHAARRRYIQAGTRMIQRAESGAPVDEIAEMAATDVRSARDERTGVELLTQRVDEFMGTEVPEPDWIIPGLLARADRIVITGAGGLGKALAADTPVPTVAGWSTMVALAVGDQVFGPDGVPTEVVAASEVMTGRPCYQVTFSDGAVIIADEQHLWMTETVAARGAAKMVRTRATKLRGTDQSHKRRHFPAIITTGEMARTLRNYRGELNHSINVAAPLLFPERHLPIPPYVLGAWLGDGHSAGARITCADDQIVGEIRSEGIPCRHMGGYLYSLSDGVRRGRGQDPGATLVGRLRALGVLGEKHIPASYLAASSAQRLALLQGLMDTDGTIWFQGGATRGGRLRQSICEFSVMNERLAHDVRTLLATLGIKAAFRSCDAVLNGRKVGVRYRLSFQTQLPVFRLIRKLERITPTKPGSRRATLRYVTAVEPVASVPVKCIQVAREDGMYVAGRECIPTHNSTLLRQIGVSGTAGVQPFDWDAPTYDPARLMIFDCENRDWRLKRALWPLLRMVREMGRAVEDRITIGGGGNPLNLFDKANVLSLLRTVEHDRPDIVYIGPYYKLHAEDPDKESTVKRVTSVLDDICKTGAAVMIEAHPNKESKKGGPMSPSGSGMWEWWPEYGFGLRQDPDSYIRRCALERWRIDRDASAWPQTIEEDGRWPWARADRERPTAYDNSKINRIVNGES